MRLVGRNIFYDVFAKFNAHPPLSAKDKREIKVCSFRVIN